MSIRPFQLPAVTLAQTNVAQAINVGSTILAHTVLLYAQSSNVGVIVIGNSGVGVANSAIRIGPNETWLFDRVEDVQTKYNLNTIYVAGQSADKVLISYTSRVLPYSGPTQNA